MPDTTREPPPQGFIDQVCREYEHAKAHLAWAAEAGRAAQAVWQRAVDREMEAHRRMRQVMNGEWPSDQT